MIPPDIAATMREALESYLSTLEALMDNYNSFQREKARIDAALAYLDTLPAAPALDWSQAPGWATHHVYNCKGSGLWTEGECVVSEGWSSGWNGVVPEITKSDYSGYRLPIGIDWRTTLQARPKGDR